GSPPRPHPPPQATRTPEVQNRYASPAWRQALHGARPPPTLNRVYRYDIAVAELLRKRRSLPPLRVRQHAGRGGAYSGQRACARRQRKAEGFNLVRHLALGIEAIG